MIVWTYIAASLALVFGLAGVYLGLTATRRRAPRRELPGISLVHSCGGTWGKWEQVTLTVRNSYGESMTQDAQDRSCTECGFTERVQIIEGNRK